METAMRNFLIAALAIFAFAGFVTSAEARSKARAMTEAAEFVQELKSSGQFEIESSTVALKKSQNEDLRKFAQKMIDDHKAADQKLFETLKQANLPDPQYSMIEEQKDLLLTLTALEGLTFDRKYVQDQIQAHNETINLLTSYSQRGDNSELKQLASTLLPTIKEHLQMAEGLRPSVTARR
jgi:putative membrane protein